MGNCQHFSFYFGHWVEWILRNTGWEKKKQNKNSPKLRRSCRCFKMGWNINRIIIHFNGGSLIFGQLIDSVPALWSFSFLLAVFPAKINQSLLDAGPIPWVTRSQSGGNPNACLLLHCFLSLWLCQKHKTHPWIMGERSRFVLLYLCAGGKKKPLNSIIIFL